MIRIREVRLGRADYRLPGVDCGIPINVRGSHGDSKLVHVCKAGVLRHAPECTFCISTLSVPLSPCNDALESRDSAGCQCMALCSFRLASCTE